MRRQRYVIAVFLCCSLLLFCPAASFGEAELADSQKNVLQKSLSIYEIDQELSRLSEQENELNQRIRDTERQMIEQDGRVEEMRKHAAQTMRAYYMGERNSIWLLLFSAESLSDALKLYEYLSMIIDNDQRSLRQYAATYSELEALRKQLLHSQQELQQTKASFLTQRVRLAALEREREEQLSREKDAELLRKQSEQLIDNWVHNGLPMFKTYFAALSQAMDALPNVLLEDKKNRYLTFSGLNATFQMTDRELNEYLRGQNPALTNLTFTFNDNQMVITGKEGITEITIKGHYALEKKDANTIILYHIDELTYDGYNLPDTTAKALEKEFDLGFYPDSFASFLETTSLVMEKGSLTIKFRLKL